MHAAFKDLCEILSCMFAEHREVLIPASKFSLKYLQFCPSLSPLLSSEHTSLSPTRASLAKAEILGFY